MTADGAHCDQQSVKEPFNIFTEKQKSKIIRQKLDELMKLKIFRKHEY